MFIFLLGRKMFMNEKKRETLLKIMSIMAMFLSIYPLTSIVRISLFKENKEFLDCFFYLVVISSTFIAVSLIMHENYTRKGIILAHGFLIIPIIASIIYFFSYGTLSIVFGAFITAILCFFTIRVYFKEYNYLISGSKLYVGIVMILLALIFSTYFEELKYLKNQFYIFTFIFAFFILVIRNQSNLDSIFSKRFDKASGIPEKMRSYNIKKIIVFFLLIVGVFYFRDVLIAGLQGLVGLLELVFRILWSFFSTLMEKLRQLVSVEEVDLPSSPDIDYINNEANGGNGGNPILDTVCNIIAILLVAFTVYKIATVLTINVLIPFFKKTFKRLLEKIITLFEKTEYKEEKTHYYTDRIERVLPSDFSKKSKKPKKTPNISKALKQAEKIENPKEKVKYLYSFILKYMSAKGVDIKKSYSTGEIYKKAKEIDQLDEPFGEITSVYDRVKYGDKIPKVSQVDDTKSNTIKSIEIIKKIK